MNERVRLPADIELEDRLAFGLTARQLLLLGASALASYGLYLTSSAAAPPPLAAALAAPVAFCGLLLALGRRDGLSGDRFALAAARFLARPKRRVLAPEGVPSSLPGAPARPGLAPLDLPVHAVLRSGLVDLGSEGFCVLLRASSASFALRSEEEQAALVEAFGRFLNAIQEPVEIVVSSEPVDLAARAAALERAANDLDDKALQRAARGHARFLAQLAATSEVRRREILLVLGTRARDAATARTTLERRATEATTLLGRAAVELRRLDGVEAAALLGRALAPPGPPPGSSLTGVVSGC